MKCAALLLGAAMVVLAAPQAPGDGPVNCAKPNASYCVEADIILRCDDNALGYPARCSPNLSGYPPAGGIATCWQSGEETGDAACQKNCIVYPEPPEPAFTLASDECTPSHSESHSPHPVPTHTLNSTITTTVTATHCKHGCTETPPPPPPPSTDTLEPTEVPSPPPGSTEGTVPPPEVTATISLPPPPPPPSNGTWVPTVTNPPPPGSTGDVPPPPPPGTTGGSDEPTNVPPPPPTATGPETPPIGAAVSNRAGILLGFVGFVVAYLL